MCSSGGGWSLILLRGIGASFIHSFQHQHDRALLDLAAHGYFNFLDHTRLRRGDFHRGLVRLHGDQALLGLDRVAHIDQQFYDRNFIQVTNVRDFYFYDCHVLVLNQLGTERRCASVCPAMSF